MTNIPTISTSKVFRTEDVATARTNSANSLRNPNGANGAMDPDGSASTFFVPARLLLFKGLLFLFGEVGRLETVRSVNRSPSHCARRNILTIEDISIVENALLTDPGPIADLRAKKTRISKTHAGAQHSRGNPLLLAQGRAIDVGIHDALVASGSRACTCRMNRKLGLRQNCLLLYPPLLE
jgi:hypothetical protein